MDLVAALRSAAGRAGLSGLWIASAEPFEETRRAIEDRVAGGLHGALRATYRRPAVAADIRLSFPWAERLVVVGYSYLPAAGSPGPARPGTGRAARFTVGDQYRPLRTGLEDLAGLLRGAGHRAEVLCDDGRLADRAAAVRAGVGWWGKSTVVISPRQGPWLLLGSVATDACLPRSVASRRDCGTCTACLSACPTGALILPGVLDARRCLSALSQAPGAVPLAFRRVMGDRVYGCDECLEACPPGHPLLGAAPESRGRIDLPGLLATADVDLRRRFGHWYLPRRDVRYVRRNALVAMGNAGGAAAMEAAVGYLHHLDPLLRGHAAWAVGRLGGPAAGPALRRAAAREHDPGVSEEIRRALAGEDRSDESGSVH